ncbi:MAG: OmpA family protein [Myxococcota bacterium]
MNISFSASTFYGRVLALGLVAVAACASSNANMEVTAAQQAIDEARAAKAEDCAIDIFRSAEAALAAARELNAAGEADAAKAKAAEATALAGQARTASPPGCDQPKDPEPPPPPPPDETVSRSINIAQIASSPVYFDYNDASIRDDSKELLSRVAEALLNAPGQRLEVEGHCDVRGSTEYNLHLGERRAQAVMRYLIKQGVGAEQVSIISYGEERPVDLGASEDAHQRNRRAELKPL